MLNQFTLVGRITSDPQINEVENGRKETIIKIAVSRAYKNELGFYDTDFFPITLYNKMAETTCEYCRKGDIIGIKGMMQTKENNIILLAEKVSFLSSKAGKEEEKGE